METKYRIQCKKCFKFHSPNYAFQKILNAKFVEGRKRLIPIATKDYLTTLIAERSTENPRKCLKRKSKQEKKSIDDFFNNPAKIILKESTEELKEEVKEEVKEGVRKCINKSYSLINSDSLNYFFTNHIELRVNLEKGSK